MWAPTPWSMQASCCLCSLHSMCPHGETWGSVSFFLQLDNTANTEGSHKCFRESQAPSLAAGWSAMALPPSACTPYPMDCQLCTSLKLKLSGPRFRSEGPSPPSAGITHTPDAQVFHQVSHLFILPWSQKEEREACEYSGRLSCFPKAHPNFILPPGSSG